MTRNKVEQKPLPNQTLWVACDLNDADKEVLKKKPYNANEMMGGLSALVDAHYRITISFDEKADCVGAYLTAPREKASDPVKCLSARGHTLDQALISLLYKHFEKLQEDWGGVTKGGALIDPWG